MTLINCNAEGNKGGGFKVGKNSQLFNCTAKGNGGLGFDDAEYTNILNAYKLPKEINHKDLAELLNQILGKNPQDSEEIIKKSSLLEKIGKYSSPASIVSSLLSMSANPNVHELIKWLSGL